jgi:hypothetical protein
VPARRLLASLQAYQRGRGGLSWRRGGGGGARLAASLSKSVRWQDEANSQAGCQEHATVASRTTSMHGYMRRVSAGQSGRGIEDRGLAGAQECAALWEAAAVGSLSATASLASTCRVSMPAMAGAWAAAAGKRQPAGQPTTAPAQLSSSSPPALAFPPQHLPPVSIAPTPPRPPPPPPQPPPAAPSCRATASRSA